MKMTPAAEWGVVRGFCIVLATVALLVASCGGDDGTANGEDGEVIASPTTVDTTATSSTTEAAAGTSSSTTADQPDSVEEISVYFGTGDSDVCDAVAPHTRTVPADTDPLRFAFDQLVAGPTDQERQGAFSFFSDETDGTVRSITTDGGSLVVDFEDFRNILTPAGANTSCGSAALLGELNATAFQFPNVDLVRYELEGSCDVFGEWLQRACIEVDRTEWAEGVASQLPGEPFDGVLPPGAVLAVIGVGADDQLNVRASPGADQPIVGRLDPLATGLVFSGRARLVLPGRSVWYEIQHGDVIGWIASRFAAPLDGTVDVTSEIVEALGEIPTDMTTEELGATVIEVRTRNVDIEPSSIVVDGPRTVGDLTEIIYDLTGFRDDAVLGERLHLFATESATGSGHFELVRVEVTAICARGSGGPGLCP